MAVIGRNLAILDRAHDEGYAVDREFLFLGHQLDTLSGSMALPGLA